MTPVLQVDWVSAAADVALLLASLPFFALGWMAGVAVRCVLWVVAAVIAGYRSGRG